MLLGLLASVAVSCKPQRWRTCSAIESRIRFQPVPLEAFQLPQDGGGTFLEEEGMQVEENSHWGTSLQF